MEDAQQQHDKRRMGRKVQLKPDSVKRLDALLAKKGRPAPYDPVESIMRNHPAITRESAAQIIEDYGF